MTCLFVDFFFKINDLLGKFVAHVFQDGRVNLDAFHFHFGNHRDQRTFNLLVHRHHFFARKAGFQNGVKAQRNLRIFCRVIQCFIKGDIIKRHLIFAFARDFFIFDRLVTAEQFGKLIHAVAVFGAIQHVRQQHRVITRGHFHAVLGDHLPVIFHVMTDLHNALIGQHGLHQLHNAL